MIVFQALDELKTLGDFFNRVVQLTIGNPILAVDALQIVNHQDHLVVCAQSHRIVIVAELLSEHRTRRHQVSERRRNFKTRFLVGRLVPVEDTSGHGNRNRQQLSVDGALRQRALAELGQVDDVRNLIEVVELAGAVRVGEGVEPVPVDLVHIKGRVGSEVLAHLVFPAAPRAVGAGHVDAGCRLEGIYSLLGRFVASVTAPPREGQRALRHCANGGQCQCQSQHACDKLFHHSSLSLK